MRWAIGALATLALLELIGSAVLLFNPSLLGTGTTPGCEILCFTPGQQLSLSLTPVSGLLALLASLLALGSSIATKARGWIVAQAALLMLVCAGVYVLSRSYISHVFVGLLVVPAGALVLGVGALLYALRPAGARRGGGASAA